MKNNILLITTLVSTMSIAGGYKIPEQSVNSMALSASYTAHTMGADTNYYNPANMSFMEDKNYFEAGISLAHLFKQTFTSSSPTLSGESEVEDLPIPNFHYVSSAMGNFRAGFSMVVPAGLTKRWETPFQKLSAEEFTLKVVELNPTLSYSTKENVSIGAGVRLVYSEGIVKSDGGNNPKTPIKRDMKGEGVAFGYNLAWAYKSKDNLQLGMTYRSKVDLKNEGEANLYFFGIGKQFDAEVTVPLPASLDIGVAKTWNDKFTIEVNYARTFWSAYEVLDFKYTTPIQSNLKAPFDDPAKRDWKDSDSLKIGITYRFSDLTLMAGAEIDETPVENRYLGFELADSLAKVFSVGFKYKMTPNLSIGSAFLMTLKDDITLKKDFNEGSVLSKGGEFTDGGAFLATMGIAYEF